MNTWRGWLLLLAFVAVPASAGYGKNTDVQGVDWDWYCDADGCYLEPVVYSSEFE